MNNYAGLPLVKPDLTKEENWTGWLRNLAREYLITGFILGFIPFCGLSCLFFYVLANR
jgi:hypothetical protein